MSSTSIVNGKRTSTHQETYTYIVQAVSAGTFTLPAATATVGKDNCTSGTFTIEVVSGEKRAQAAANDPADNSAAVAADREAGNGATYVNIDLKQMGLGGINTWNTEPLPDYQIPADEYVFKFVVRPHYKH